MPVVPDDAMRGPIVHTSYQPQQMPIHIRAVQKGFGADANDYVQRKLCDKLAKFNNSIDRIILSCGIVPTLICIRKRW